MKNLKDLTPDQCIKIASIAKPTIEWKFIVSKNKWNGFDLIENSHDEDEYCKYVFQIDYQNNLHVHQIFRFYDDCYQYIISEELIKEIFNYLETI